MRTTHTHIVQVTSACCNMSKPGAAPEIRVALTTCSRFLWCRPCLSHSRLLRVHVRGVPASSCPIGSGWTPKAYLRLKKKICVMASEISPEILLQIVCWHLRYHLRYYIRYAIALGGCWSNPELQCLLRVCMPRRPFIHISTVPDGIMAT